MLHQSCISGVKDIIIDPGRGSFIKEIFEKVAYYYYSGRQVKEFLDHNGFTTRTGKKISTSMVYLMLRNPFYYGSFEFPVKSGIWYKGSHEALITKETFDEVQKELDTGHPPQVWGKKNLLIKVFSPVIAVGHLFVEKKNIVKEKMEQ